MTAKNLLLAIDDLSRDDIEYVYDEVYGCNWFFHTTNINGNSLTVETSLGSLVEWDRDSITDLFNNLVDYRVQTNEHGFIDANSNDEIEEIDFHELEVFLDSWCAVKQTYTLGVDALASIVKSEYESLTETLNDIM